MENSIYILFDRVRYFIVSFLSDQYKKYVKIKYFMFRKILITCMSKADYDNLKFELTIVSRK